MKLIKHGHSYALLRNDKLIAFAHPEDFTNDNVIGTLSLNNCQAIERGYDLDELSRKIREEEELQIKIGKSLAEGITASLHFEEGVRKGFQKAIEILGDKKFTEEDVVRIVDFTLKDARKAVVWSETYHEFVAKDAIQSLQQNEWEVEVEMEYQDMTGKWFSKPTILSELNRPERPKLDAEGFLILKRI